MRIVYVEDARIPTEKAHGLQISKMCEAFAHAGHVVSLWIPHRHQANPALEDSLFDEYDVDRVFDVRAVANVDITRLGPRVLGSWLGKTLISFHSMLWAGWVSRLAARVPADTFFTRNPRIALALTRRKLPVTLELHSIPRMFGRRSLEHLAGVRWLRGVVAITDGIADELVNLGFRRSMIKVLPDAADLRQYVDLPSRDEARRSLGLPLDRPLVGYVGRFQTMGLEKGLHQLVKAIGHLEEPISMVAVGGPLSLVTSYLEQPGATKDLADRCWFFDRVPPRDVPTWIAAFDVVTIPWPDEPHFARYASPMKLFEYLAAGAAIVASDLPAIREVLTDRKDSWLVTPGDPLALAEGIRELLSDPLLRDRLGEEARTRSFAFSWEDRARAALEGWVP